MHTEARPFHLADFLTTKIIGLTLARRHEMLT
jgi:hypothetical protein